jgi:transposase-like protein
MKNPDMYTKEDIRVWVQGNYRDLSRRLMLCARRHGIRDISEAEDIVSDAVFFALSDKVVSALNKKSSNKSLDGHLFSTLATFIKYRSKALMSKKRREPNADDFMDTGGIERPRGVTPPEQESYVHLKQLLESVLSNRDMDLRVVSRIMDRATLDEVRMELGLSMSYLVGTHHRLVELAREHGFSGDITSLVPQQNCMTDDEINLLSESEVETKVAGILWASTNGTPVCPKCGGVSAYRLRTRAIWKCKSCSHQFTLTSGSPFSHRKLPLREYLRFLIRNESETSTNELSKKNSHQWKTTKSLRRRAKSLANGFWSAA